MRENVKNEQEKIWKIKLPYKNTAYFVQFNFVFDLFAIGSVPVESKIENQLIYVSKNQSEFIVKQNRYVNSHIKIGKSGKHYLYTMRTRRMK